MKRNKIPGTFLWMLGILLLCISLLAELISEAFYRSAIPTDFENIEVIAHRGVPKEFPENSLDGFLRAIDLKCDRVELDVHQTADGELVVLHDYSLERTSSMTGLVKNHPAKDIEKYNLGLAKNEEGMAPLPFLRDVLKRIHGRINVVVELKSGDSFYPEIEQRLVALIHELNAVEWVSIHSFDDEVLADIHAIDSNIALYKLLIFYIPGIHLMVDQGVHFKSIESYPHVSGFSVNYIFANEKLIEEVHLLKKKINVWNLNDEKLAMKLFALNIDGVITDSPEEMMQLKSKQGSLNIPF